MRPTLIAAIDSQFTSATEAETVPSRSGHIPILAKAGAVGVFLLVLAGAFGYFGLSMWRSHRLATSRISMAGMGLKAIHARDGHLDLSWDRNAPAVRNAQKGIFSIQDGTQHRELGLDKTQLHFGQLVYFPTHGDVHFQLEIFLDQKRSVRESLHVLPSPRTHAKLATAPKQVPKRIPPPQRTPTALASGPSNMLEHTPETGRLSQVPPMRPEGLVIYVPPRAIKKVMPDLGLVQPVEMASNPEVKIQVKVDPSGMVTEARAIQNGKQVNRMFLNAALAAAEHWVFEPATLRGKPVSAYHTILFEVAHQSQ